MKSGGAVAKRADSCIHTPAPHTTPARFPTSKTDDTVYIKTQPPLIERAPCSLLFYSFHHLINSIYQPFIMATPTPPPPRERRPSTGAPISDLRGPVGPPGFTRPKHKRTLTGFGAGEIKSVEGELFSPSSLLACLSNINSHHRPPSQLPSRRTSALPGRGTTRNPSRPPRTSRRKSCTMSRRRSPVACSTATRRPRMPLPVWRSETA